MKKRQKKKLLNKEIPSLLPAWEVIDDYMENESLRDRIQKYGLPLNHWSHEQRLAFDVAYVFSHDAIHIQKLLLAFKQSDEGFLTKNKQGNWCIVLLLEGEAIYKKTNNCIYQLLWDCFVWLLELDEKHDSLNPTNEDDIYWLDRGQYLFG
ncbi:hypothetical protein [Bacillus safensis]|uniref:hypothetical protein n=1 Tax=Bacillus safensis TaxID=561879 RepID=UPI0036701A81